MIYPLSESWERQRNLDITKLPLEGASHTILFSELTFIEIQNFTELKLSRKIKVDQAFPLMQIHFQIFHVSIRTSHI